jgi:hypothetical protein
VTDRKINGVTVRGGTRQYFAAPFSGVAVLYLHQRR